MITNELFSFFPELFVSQNNYIKNDVVSTKLTVSVI